jgi:16S rRNA (guanine527-N7)-methyltransferase
LTSKEFTQRLKRRAKRAGVAVSDELSAKLWVYFDLLYRWNEKINLTSLSLDTPDETVDRLLVEPLVAAREVRPGDKQAIDLGSGGGSPAIPMKLATGALRLVMVESKARKSAFLREAIRQLGLDASVETARFEELLSKPEFHESFDLLTLRAVRTEARTLNTIQAFVRSEGRILLFRSKRNSDTLPVVPPLRRRESLALTPGTELLVLEKIRIP